MKVKLLKDYRFSPDGKTVDKYIAGEEHDLDEKLAKRLIGSKTAAQVKAPAKKKASPKPETAPED